MKKTNKGFSLVELIIVIAIMAILAGAIAPALIRYIDKSRKSNDVTAAKDIKTALETALGNENLYELCTAGKQGAGGFTAVLYVEPGEKIEKSSGSDNTAACITVKVPANTTYSDTEIKTDSEYHAALQVQLAREVATNIGEKMPKCKYKKNASNTKSDVKPAQFVATVSSKGTVSVYVACVDGSLTKSLDYKPVLGQDDDAKGPALATDFMLVPEVSSYYQ